MRTNNYSVETGDCEDRDYIRVEEDNYGVRIYRDTNYGRKQGYFNILTIGPNGEAKFMWKHAQGEGSIEIPSGEIYCLLPMLLCLNETKPYKQAMSIYRDEPIVVLGDGE